MKKKCPQTGEIFECGADTTNPDNQQTFSCWCQNLPVIPPSSEECLGPIALAEIAKSCPATQSLSKVKKSTDSA